MMRFKRGAAALPAGIARFGAASRDLGIKSERTSLNESFE